MSLLTVRGLEAGYGSATVVRGVDLDVEDGEAVCILGRNGVGKSTLLKGLLGLTFVSGQRLFRGQDLARLKTEQIARCGLGYVPQGREIFAGLTVRENLRLGATPRLGRSANPPTWILDYFPVLAERGRQRAGSLSGGEQQMLAFARALNGDPRLLLLDEPSEGIQPNLVDRLLDVLVRANRERGLTILIVEQNLEFALRVASRGYVMEKGQVVASGSTSMLRSDKIVRSHLEI
jgi:urea transport system ATP-binding protein